MDDWVSSFPSDVSDVLMSCADCSVWNSIKFDDDIMDDDIQSVSSTESEAWSTERTSGE